MKWEADGGEREDKGAFTFVSCIVHNTPLPRHSAGFKALDSDPLQRSFQPSYHTHRIPHHWHHPRLTTQSTLCPDHSMDPLMTSSRYANISPVSTPYTVPYFGRLRESGGQGESNSLPPLSSQGDSSIPTSSCTSRPPSIVGSHGPRV